MARAELSGDGALCPYRPLGVWEGRKMEGGGGESVDVHITHLAHVLANIGLWSK